MAGFFGLFDYTKEGKGIEKEDLPQSNIAIYFSVLGRRFWKLITLNLMFIFFSLPIIICSYFISSFLLAFLLPNLNINELSELLLINVLDLKEELAQQLAGRAIFLTQVVMTALNLSLLYHVFGPIHTGLTYILRNYSRDDHSFLWMDFKDNLINNFKQSFVSTLISVVLNFLFLFSLAFYGHQFQNNNLLRIVVVTILTIVFFYFSIMNIYLYQMMVTFNLSLKNLYKNASLFTILRLPFNLLLLVFNMLVIVGIPLLLFFTLPSIDLVFLITLFWYATFAFAWVFYTQNFYVNIQIKKYMLSRMNEINEDNEDNTAEI